MNKWKIALFLVLAAPFAMTLTACSGCGCSNN
jgi:hypothetical protein